MRLSPDLELTESNIDVRLVVHIDSYGRRLSLGEGECVSVVRKEVRSNVREKAAGAVNLNGGWNVNRTTPTNIGIQGQSDRRDISRSSEDDSKGVIVRWTLVISPSLLRVNICFL